MTQKNRLGNSFTVITRLGERNAQATQRKLTQDSNELGQQIQKSELKQPPKIAALTRKQSKINQLVQNSATDLEQNSTETQLTQLYDSLQLGQRAVHILG